MRLNIYQMWIAHGGGGFLVRRRGWAYSTRALILELEEPLRGEPPYFQNPRVRALLFTSRSQPQLVWLPCAGTFTYELVPTHDKK